ncbi:MAG TPA: asparaginase [Anaerolineales bacterium]
MTSQSYFPIFELTRGKTIESIHNGAIAVVDAYGKPVASYGDPDTLTFLRSSAKPFQALPFIEHGGQDFYHLTRREIALMCASHSGTDEHVAVAREIQAKTGVSESDLLCGVHYPYDNQTSEALRERKEQPTPNRHNCSGKHTGMLAYARMEHLSTADYIDNEHPVQREIRQTFANMCALPVEQVALGIDGCSAPNFAVPLRNSALAYARLLDPVAGQVQPPARAAACRTITTSMMENPDMVGGPGRFDTRLMEVARRRILIKAGAEGYQGIGLAAGALGSGSPALGIALKIGDGDARAKARPAVVLEVLRQLGALSAAELALLAEFGPTFPVLNWRKIEVGEGRPCFELHSQN